METANWLHTLVVNGALEMEGCPTDVICEFSISGWLELMAGAAIHSVMIRPLSTHIRTYQTGHLSFFYKVFFFYLVVKALSACSLLLVVLFAVQFGRS